MPGGRELQEGQADATALGSDRDTALRRELPGERGVQPNLAVRVEHAHAVRTDQTHAVGPGLVEHLPLEPATFFVQFCEAGADDDKRRHSGGCAFIHNTRDFAPWRRDDGQFNVTWHVANRTVAGPPSDFFRTWVDRVDGSLEPSRRSRS